MYKVFVSYSTHDLPDVTLLKESLKDSGVEVFVAHDSVKPSGKLSEEISAAITSCDLFVLVWSENAKNSDWVPQEIGKAHQMHKKILPIVLTQGLNLPGFITDLKYLDAFRDKPRAIASIREQILEGFREKQRKVAEAKQKEQDANAKALLAIGGFALWLFSR